MAKEFVYNKVCDLGELGDTSVEIGHYIVDGKQMADKVYLVAGYKKKDGTENHGSMQFVRLTRQKTLQSFLNTQEVHDERLKCN